MDSTDDPFDLARFTTAQEPVYDRVLAELKGGRKRTHWMWFVFPQIDGLGQSATSKRYAVKGRAEARAYLDDPVLRARLRECAEAVLAIEGRSANGIFGSPDDMKLKSSMTLFAMVGDDVFERVLERFFQGKPDAATLRLLDESGESA